MSNIAFNSLASAASRPAACARSRPIRTSRRRRRRSQSGAMVVSLSDRVEGSAPLPAAIVSPTARRPISIRAVCCACHSALSPVSARLSRSANRASVSAISSRSSQAGSASASRSDARSRAASALSAASLPGPERQSDAPLQPAATIGMARHATGRAFFLRRIPSWGDMLVIGVAHGKPSASARRFQDDIGRLAQRGRDSVRWYQ